MKKTGAVLVSVMVTAAVWAQEDKVTTAERQRASLVILGMVVGGLLVVYLLMWWLRKKGKLPEEKPVEKALWVHPEDEEKQGTRNGEQGTEGGDKG
ncbi:MAG: hypothetical protein ABFE07_11180 [Armatimonadia bacterium]